MRSLLIDTTDTGTPRQSRRRVVHASMLAFSLLLRWLRPWQAQCAALLAIAFNWWALPRLGVNLDKRQGAARHSHRAGLLVYPFTVLLLLLLFPGRMYISGAAWAIMALGDPVAAYIGERVRWRWPFNPQKSIAGSLGYIVAGAVGAWALLLYLRSPLTGSAAVGAALFASGVAAIVEALPLHLDDNFSAPLASAIALELVFRLRAAGTLPAYSMVHDRWVHALAVCGGFAIVAWMLRLISTSAAIVGFVIAFVIWLGFGASGFLSLLTFFVLGVVATKAGYVRKARLGVAERRGGRRRWTQVVANGIVPAGCAGFALIGGAGTAAALAAAAALAEAASDTVSSEAGQALTTRVFMIGSFRRVPVGTDGGVSLAGTVAGVLASALLAIVAAGSGLVPAHQIIPIIVVATVGNLIDSVLGATLERRELLDNDTVNFLGTLSASLLSIPFLR